MHIYKNPLLLGAFPAALEGGLDVSVPAVASQRKADPTEDCLGVSGRRIIVPEKASIRRVPSQHSHNITKLLSAKMALELRCTSEHPKCSIRIC
jgi:hypothetical protein